MNSVIVALSNIYIRLYLLSYKEFRAMRKISISNHSNAHILPILKTVDQWVCWAEHRFSRKDDKIPLNTEEYNPSQNEFSAASFSDESIWMPYEKAVEKCDQYDAVTGIGFVITDDVNIALIDIDDCIKTNSLKLDKEAYEMMNFVGSYAEVSPSGTGIHIISRGKAPRHGWAAENQSMNISVWDRDWMTITEKHIKNTSKEIRGDNYLLNSICDEYGIDMHEPWVK